MNDEKSFKLLVECTSRMSIDIAVSAASSLGKRGDPRAVVSLVELLERIPKEAHGLHQDDFIREHFVKGCLTVVQNALGKLGYDPDQH
jgi:HEAT repeat protein